MGLKVHKAYHPIGGYFYALDMGLLCKYTLTFGVTTSLMVDDQTYVAAQIIHGKTLRRAYKQMGVNTMDGWCGE